MMEHDADVGPKTAENSRALCTGENGLDRSGKPLYQMMGKMEARAKTPKPVMQTQMLNQKNEEAMRRDRHKQEVLPFPAIGKTQILRTLLLFKFLSDLLWVTLIQFG